MINYVKKHKKQLFFIFFCALLAFFICLLSPINPFSRKIIGTDTWVFQYNALAMKNGMLPYIDFFDHKGILLYFINLIGILINKNYGIWLIELIFLFFAIFFAKKTLDLFDKNEIRKYFVLTLVMSLLVTTFEGGNTTEEYFLPFAIYSQFVFLKFLLKGKIKNIEVMFTGISLAVVCLLRINMIGLWGINILAIFIKLLKKQNFKDLIKYTLLFILGVCIIFIPTLVYMIYKGIFKAFIDSYIIFNLKYSDVTSLEKYYSFKYFVSILIILVALISNLLLIFNNNKCNKDVLIINVISLIINLSAICISGKTYLHYAVVILPNLFVPYIYLLKCFEKDGINKLIMGYLLIYILIPNIFTYIDNINKLKEYDDKNYLEIAEYIKKNTKETDKISIFGNKNSLYILSERFSASKYSYQVPLIDYDSEIFNSYSNDIINNKAKIVYIAYNSSELENILSKNNYFEIKDNLYILK